LLASHYEFERKLLAKLQQSKVAVIKQVHDFFIAFKPFLELAD